MIDDIFCISKDIRYVAVYHEGHLEMKAREPAADASSRNRTAMRNCWSTPR